MVQEDIERIKNVYQGMIPDATQAEAKARVALNAALDSGDKKDRKKRGSA